MAGSKDLVINILAHNKTKPGFQAAVGGIRGITSALGGVKLAQFGKDSVNTFKTVTSQSLGLKRAIGGTVEEASRLRFAASRGGQDIGTFTTSVTRLGKNLETAARTGSGPAVQAMESLGVEFRNADGSVRPLAGLIPDIAEGFKNLPDGSQKSAAALALFGKSGASLTPFLNRGKASIEELMAKTGEFNQVVGQEQVDAYLKNLNAQRDFEQQLTGLKMSIGQSILPAITPLVETLGTLTELFASAPQPVKTLTFAVLGGALAYNTFGGAAGAAVNGIKWLAVRTGASTSATVADTLATKANTSAKFENAKAAGAGGGKAAGALGVAAKSTAVLAGMFAVVEATKMLDQVTKGASQSENQLVAVWGTMSNRAMDLIPVIGQLKSSLNLKDRFDAWREGRVPIEELGEAVKTVAGMVDQSKSKAINAVSEMAEKTGNDYHSIIESNGELKGKLEQLGYSADMPIEKFRELGKQSSETADGIEETGDAAGSAANDLDEFGKQLEAAIAPGLALQRATDDQVESIESLKKSAKESGTSLRGSGEDARKNREAIMSAVDSNMKYATAVARAKGSAEAGRKAYDDKTAALIRSAKAAGFDERQVRSLAKTLKSVDEQKARPKVDVQTGPAVSKTKAVQQMINALKQSRKPVLGTNASVLQAQLKAAQVRLNGLRQDRKPDVRAIDQTKRTISDIKTRLIGIRDKEVRITTIETHVQKLFGKGATVPGSKNNAKAHNKATGGDTSGPAIVGERGPELLWLPEGSHVETAATTRSLLANGIEHFAKGRKGKAKKKADTPAQKRLRDKIRKMLTTSKGKNSTLNSAMKSKVSERDSLTASLKGSVSAFTGISAWNPQENEDRKQALVDADEELAEARQALNRSALGTAERSESATRVAKAVAAKKAAEANKPETMAQWMRRRVQGVQQWVANLKILKGTWGKTTAGKALLAEVFDAGPEQGLALSNELLKDKGSLSELMTIQSQSLSAASALVGTDHRVAGMNAEITSMNAKLKLQGQGLQSIETILKLDGKAIHKSLLNLKKSQKGKSLGL